MVKVRESSVISAPCGRVLRRGPSQETSPQLESAQRLSEEAQWLMVHLHSSIPFPNEMCPIARGLHVPGDRRHISRNTSEARHGVVGVKTLRHGVGIEHVDREPAGLEAAASRRARLEGIMTRQFNTRASEVVNIWCGHLWRRRQPSVRAMVAHIGPSPAQQAASCIDAAWRRLRLTDQTTEQQLRLTDRPR